MQRPTNYDDPDFSGVQIFGKTYPMPLGLVLILKVALVMSPLGLLANTRDDDGKISHLATWFLRAVSAACCYTWWSLITQP